LRHNAEVRSVITYRFDIFLMLARM
ncbi:MAG: hypothetical protein V7606_1135, partial [Burkholderiales bacterium]